MKRYLLLLLVCLSVVSLSAQTLKEAQIRQRVNQAAAAMKTMQCDFVQTKHLKMLNDVMVAQGKMYYQQHSKLRWEYTNPYAYTFVLNGDKVLLKNRQQKKLLLMRRLLKNLLQKMFLLLMRLRLLKI